MSLLITVNFISFYKHASFSHYGINYDWEKFYNTGPWYELFAGKARSLAKRDASLTSKC
jgi:hypothetical protein